jgi:hypothetical protein
LPCEVDGKPLTDGYIARLLVTHFRRERGDFVGIGLAGDRSRSGNRSGTL